MIEIGTDGTCIAEFTEDGSLARLRASGLEWEPVAPAWGVSVIVGEGAAQVAYRPSPDGALAAADDGTAVTCSFPSVVSDSGKRLDLGLKVRWRVEGGLLHAAASVENIASGVILDSLILPDITVRHAGGVALVLPLDSGILIRNAERHLGGDADELSDLRPHMQFAGWEEGERGLYVDSRDPEGWIKTWSFRSAGAGKARIQVRHRAPRPERPLRSFRLGYPVTLAPYRAGWFRCAAIYRDWARAQPWASRGPSGRRESYVGRIACWLWNRGAADNVVPPTNELSRRIGLPVALNWYWWHKHPYDTGYPEYFPPREGERRFRAAVKEIHDGGNFVQVYTNGMSWDEELPSWRTEGRDCTLVQEDGSYWGVIYNTWMNRRLMHTCGASEPWHRKVLENVGKGRDLGLDGIYIDQIATAGGTIPCFSAAHGHVPGGGSYGIQGFRRLLAEVRRRHPGFVISSEATRENFHDLLEANILLSTSAERMPWGVAKMDAVPIPLCSAVHHGNAVFFGNYAILDGIPPFDPLWPEAARPDASGERDWHALCPDQFALEVARTVCFGMQPMVANLTMHHLRDARLAPDVDFLVRLCRVYHAHREHLLWGEMLPPGSLRCPEHTVDCLERFVFTDPRKASINPFRYPKVLHSEWQDAGGGSKAFLLNYSRDDVTVEYEAPEGWAVRDGLPRRTIGARTVETVALEKA